MGKGSKDRRDHAVGDSSLQKRPWCQLLIIKALGGITGWPVWLNGGGTYGGRRACVSSIQPLLQSTKPAFNLNFYLPRLSSHFCTYNTTKSNSLRTISKCPNSMDQMPYSQAKCRSASIKFFRIFFNLRVNHCVHKNFPVALSRTDLMLFTTTIPVFWISVSIMFFHPFVHLQNCFNDNNVLFHIINKVLVAHSTKVMPPHTHTSYFLKKLGRLRTGDYETVLFDNRQEYLNERIDLSQGTYLNRRVKHRKTRSNINASSGIRNDGPSIHDLRTVL